MLKLHRCVYGVGRFAARNEMDCPKSLQPVGRAHRLQDSIREGVAQRRPEGQTVVQAGNQGGAPAEALLNGVDPVRSQGAVKDGVPATHHGSTARLIGEAETRGEVVRIGVQQSARNSAHARESKPPRTRKALAGISGIGAAA